MKFQVLVSGVFFDEFTDELAAYECARLTRATGWKNVTVKEVS